jgi:hypothetical protein
VLLKEAGWGCTWGTMCRNNVVRTHCRKCFSLQLGLIDWSLFIFFVQVLISRPLSSNRFCSSSFARDRKLTNRRLTLSV